MARVLRTRIQEAASKDLEREAAQFASLSSNAKKYLEAVRREAEALLEETRQRCIALEREARLTGTTASVPKDPPSDANDALRDVETRQIATPVPEFEAEDFADQLTMLFRSWESATSAWLRQWQHETVLLAIAIAEKLVRRQVEADPDILVAWIQQAVQSIRGQQSITLQVPSKVAKLVEDSLARLRDTQGESLNIEITEVDNLDDVGARIEWGANAIDLQLKSQLQRLEEELI